MSCFSDYLATLPAAEQRTLLNELTLGSGYVRLTTRLHRDGSPAVKMLGTLAAAYVSLHAALLTLDPDAADDGGSAPRVVPQDALPPDWPSLVAGSHREAVGGLLEMAAEMVRDALAATAADADVTVVSVLLADALYLLTNVRNDALGTR